MEERSEPQMCCNDGCTLGREWGNNLGREQSHPTQPNPNQAKSKGYVHHPLLLLVLLAILETAWKSQRQQLWTNPLAAYRNARVLHVTLSRESRVRDGAPHRETVERPIEQASKRVHQAWCGVLSWTARLMAAASTMCPLKALIRLISRLACWMASRSIDRVKHAWNGQRWRGATTAAVLLCSDKDGSTYDHVD